MARLKRKDNTFSILIISLLTIAVLVSSSLFWESRQKNKLLLGEIEQLKQTQVLLMVPDDQAQAVANWMSQHPEATQTLLSQAKSGEQITLEVGPGATSADITNSQVAHSEMIITDTDSSVLELSTNQGNSSRVEDTKPYSDNNLQVPVSLVRDSAGNALLPDDQQSDKLNHANENVMPIGEPNKVSSNLDEQTLQSSTLSESKDGVKVISLPHGGIRVTTRENN